MTSRESRQVSLDSLLKSSVPGIVAGWLNSDESRPIFVSNYPAESEPQIRSIFGEGWAIIHELEERPDNLVGPEDVGAFLLRRTRELAFEESRPERAFRFPGFWAYTINDGTPIELGSNLLLLRLDRAELELVSPVCAVIAREHSGLILEFGTSQIEVVLGQTAEEIELTAWCSCGDDEPQLPSELPKIVARLREALAAFETWESNQADGAPQTIESWVHDDNSCSLVYSAEDGGKVELPL